MPTLSRHIDALPVVSDPAMDAANDQRRGVTNLFEIVAAVADEVNAGLASEADADALIAATVFGLQFSLRRIPESSAARFAA